MSVDRLINVLVTITLFEMMVTIGLRVTFTDIFDTANNWRVVLCAGLANYLFVPTVAIVVTAQPGWSTDPPRKMARMA
jgi:predicted Na+-dependent transporter